MLKTKKTAILSVCLAILFGALTGCNGSEINSPTETVTEPPKNGDSVITDENVVTLDGSIGTTNANDAEVPTVEGQESSEGLKFTLHDSGERYFCTGIGNCTDTDIVINYHNGLPVTSIWGFENCTQLTSISIGGSVQSIGAHAFTGCTGLRSVYLGDSVAEIHENAFKNCSNLMSITISNNSPEIYNTSFSGTALYNDPSNWDNHVFYIGQHLISADSERISGDCIVKNGTTTIAHDAFRNCKNVTSVTIPNSVERIGNNTFQGCSALTSITIPDSITHLSEHMFHDCSSLTSIILPKSVTGFYFAVFKNCSSLTDIYYPGTKDEWNVIKHYENPCFPLYLNVHYNYQP